MSKKNFRKRRTSSSSESEVEDIKDDSGEVIKKTKLERIEELKFIQKQRERKHGIDVYSLAIGEQDNSKNITKEQQIDVRFLFELRCAHCETQARSTYLNGTCL